MKTVSMRVRIAVDKAEQLLELEDILPLNKAIDRALELLLEQEGSVYLAHLKRARAEIAERQPVLPVRIAELKAVKV